MKKLILIATIFFFAASASYAQTDNSSTQQTFQKVNSNLTPQKGQNESKSDNKELKTTQNIQNAQNADQGGSQDKIQPVRTLSNTIASPKSSAKPSNTSTLKKSTATQSDLKANPSVKTVNQSIKSDPQPK